MAKAKNVDGQHQQPERKEDGGCGFRMPLHYPRYKRADYEEMPEWRVDCLLQEYGLPADGDLDRKRRFAMGAFLWPGQYWEAQLIDTKACW
jgi:hypothetical protein